MSFQLAFAFLKFVTETDDVPQSATQFPVTAVIGIRNRSRLSFSLLLHLIVELEYITFWLRGELQLSSYSFKQAALVMYSPTNEETQLLANHSALLSLAFAILLALFSSEDGFCS